MPQEGVEQVEEEEGFDDPGDETVDDETFDGLEDAIESIHLMDPVLSGSQTPVIPNSSVPFRTCSMFPENLEAVDNEYMKVPTDCKSWTGGDVDRHIASVASPKYLPGHLEYNKLDLDVWEFEPQSYAHVEEEVLSLYEKSANATYCSQILSSFNLEETGEDLSDCDTNDEHSEGQLEALPQDLVDKFGSVKRNLLPVLEQLSISNNGNQNKKPIVNPEPVKKIWGPTVATTRMATRNHGHQNIIEKAKDYQKRKNLEVPPSFRGVKMARCQSDNKQIALDHSELEVVVPGQIVEFAGRKSDAPRSSLWRIASDCLDLNMLVFELASDKDHAGPTAPSLVNCWHQEIACEKLHESVQM